MNERFGIAWVVRQPALYMAIFLWLLLSGVGLLFSRHTPRFRGLVVGSSEYLVLVVLMFGLVALLTRKRPVLDLGQRAPESRIAGREAMAMCRRNTGAQFTRGSPEATVHSINTLTAIRQGTS